jgi:hypothetical protein
MLYGAVFLLGRDTSGKTRVPSEKTTASGQFTVMQYYKCPNIEHF